MQPINEPTNDPTNEAEERDNAASEPKLNIVPPADKPAAAPAPDPEPAETSSPVTIPPAPKIQSFSRPDYMSSAPRPAQPVLDIKPMRPAPSAVPAAPVESKLAADAASTAPAAPSVSSWTNTSAASGPTDPAPTQAAPTSPLQPFAAPQPPQSGAMETPSGDASSQGPQVIGSQDWFQSDASTPSGPVIGGGGIFGATATPPKRSKFPKPLRWGVLALLVVLLASGYVFGYYIPNKPQNVFKTGLSRTGMAIDKITTVGTEKSKLDSVKKIELTGDVTVNGPDGKQSGSFSSHYDQTKSDSSLTYKPAGSDKSFNVQALSDMPAGQSYPDLYFKISGLSAMGLDQLAPELLQYDSKWINISPAFFQSIAPADAATLQTKQPDEQFTAQDAAEITKTVVSTTREYVFTNDPTKNVLVNKSFKGKEKIENNVSADRYVVGIDKPHAKDYCKALITNVVATNGFKHIPGVSTATLNDDRDSAIKGCQESIDSSLKDSDTFDMWVNTGNKLIAKIRFTDDSDKTAYIDIGQSYTKGNVFPAFFIYHSGQEHSDARIDFTTDFDKSSSQMAFNGTFGTGSDKWTVKANAAFKPYNGDLKITKPSDAISIEKVMQTLGIDPSMFSGATDLPATTTSTNGGIQAKAKDTERQTDLKALQGQLEAYYAASGMYPKLSDLNDATWRAQNMRGLDSEALADPDGKIQALVVTATPNKQYGYNTGTCDVFNGCQSYILTAILSDGSSYTLHDFTSTTFN